MNLKMIIALPYLSCVMFALLFNISNVFADAETEFEKNRAYSLQQGTEEKQHLLHIESGVTSYYYTSIMNTVPHGAASEVTYSTTPVELGYLKLDGSLPLCFFKSEFQSNLGLQKGTVDTNDQAKDAFRMNRNADYLLQAAAGFMGIETQFSVSRYDTGEISYMISNQSYAAAPQNRDIKSSGGFSSVNKTQFDARYHFLWRDIPRLGGESRTTKAWDGYIGYRYLNYNSPSIVYLQSDDPTTGESVMAGESLPQNISIQTHLLGIGVNNYLRAVNPGFNWIVGAECYVGIGRAKADLNNYEYNSAILGSAYTSDTDANKPLRTVSFAPCGSIGFLYNFTTSVVKTSIKLEYKIDAYINKISKYQGYKVSFGHNADCFQSLNASLDLLF